MAQSTILDARRETAQLHRLCRNERIRNAKLFARITAAAIIAGGVATVADARPRVRQPFVAGHPVGVEVDGIYTPLSGNAVVFGGLVSPHSCAFDTNRGLVIVPSRGYGQNLVPNDAYVFLVNSDGSVHTLKWIGINRNGGLVLNDPTGTVITNGTLYIADIEGGTRAAGGGVNRPTTAVIRMFDAVTGEPTGSIAVEDSPGFQGIAVAPDGTIYAVQTGPGGTYPPPESQRVYRIGADGTWAVLAEGAPLSGPSAIAVDSDGNVVVVNNRNDDLMTFSPEGVFLTVEDAAATGPAATLLLTGNASVVATAEGVRYVSSATFGAITRILPRQLAEVIAIGVQEAISMCHDPVGRKLSVPLGGGNALAIIQLP